MRPGIWATSLCINDNYGLGSMLPQIKWARSHDFAVLVMNPNIDYVRHAGYVWEKFLLNSGFSEICVLAHGSGGGALI